MKFEIIKKYTPSEINNIIANKESIEKVKVWLNNDLNDSLILTGEQGIGKLTSVKLLIKNSKYNIRIINQNDIKSNKLNNELYEYYSYNNSLYTNYLIDKNKNMKEKMLLVFDEVEYITLPSEKKYLLSFFKKNNKEKLLKIIFIFSNNHSNLISFLSKSCKIINFESIKYDDIYDFIIKVLNEENINYDKNSIRDIIDKIIDISQYDIKKLLNILNGIINSLNDSNIVTVDIIDNYILSLKKKDINISLFESTQCILNNFTDFNHIINLYNKEKNLLPLMIHENYIKKINKCKYDNKNQLLEQLSEISESISYSDIVETNIYMEQNWYLQKIHGFYSSYKVSYNLNKYRTVSNPITKESIDFSKELNKNSLKNINKKNIYNLYKCLNINNNIYDILLIVKILNYGYENNSKYIYKFIKYFNLSNKDLNLFLKINKCDNIQI